MFFGGSRFGRQRRIEANQPKTRLHGQYDYGVTSRTSKIKDRDPVCMNSLDAATGAWYDPAIPAEEKSLEIHGNPNVLPRDVGTSKLAQGPTAHSCLVQVERFDQPLPPVKVFQQPKLVTGDA